MNYKEFWLIVLLSLALTYLFTGFKSDRELFAYRYCSKQVETYVNQYPKLDSTMRLQMYQDCVYDYVN